MIKSIYNRFYSDFLLPDRLVEMQRIIVAAKENGYKHLTLPEYFDQITSTSKVETSKIFIHRHDIDTDVKTARLFYKLEKQEGIKASYYFRQNTIDISLMKELHHDGFEVGYHFEEIAQYCKDNKTYTVEFVRQNMEAIQHIFLENLKKLEQNLEFKIQTVASHGDFINRMLRIPNHELISDALLHTAGLKFECYDKRLTESYSILCSDNAYPQFYRGMSPVDAINSDKNIIHFLSHPRHWRSAPLENLKDNMQRLVEGLSVKINKTKLNG